ncbi:hypothetical protein GCK32_006421 [Trichostrongylus colubriformis]|uniref:Uncharacterized protein n=1 Tax=Trichostrongylus colubriformis TaxID=6319 RepID=A0AAN8G930_TRICO
MHCLIALLLPITGSLAAIRCFQGQETIPGQAVPYVTVNCPTADFCFNSYVKRHHNGDDSYTITKSCGEVGKCFESGCEGPSDERNCCCVGDLCNSAKGVTIGIVGISLLALRAL